MKRIEDCRDLVLNGAKFRINLQTRSLSVDGKYLIKNGEHDVPLGCFHKEDWDIDNIMLRISQLYNHYKHSVPSERSESHRHSYFKALPEKELTDEDMMYGEQREFARFELEFFVLMMIIYGALTWQEEWGSWFWQSPSDKDLIILRDWIEPNKGGE